MAIINNYTYKDFPVFILNERYDLVEFSKKAEELYPSFCNPLFFKNIFNHYDFNAFSQPTILKLSTLVNSDINFAIYPLENNFLECHIMKSEYYSSFSGRTSIHFQLREPITSIFSILPITASNIEKGNTEKALENIDIIYKKSYFMLRAVTNISLSSKLFYSHSLTQKNVDLSSLIANLAKSVEENLSTININLKVERNITILANPNLISNAIMNLIANSLKYKSDEPVEINIELFSSGKYAKLKYFDNSIGISDDMLPHIFNPYFSNDFNESDLDIPSLGLGLFILKSAVDQSKGNIFVTSQVGKGVRYSISLPITEPDENEILESAPNDYSLNKFSDLYVQLNEFCDLPSLL